ncbi:hypothetical protein WH47_10112 [Habropoda laboriosa]|uniref:Uncharacterized protein n=1 Tax=Habropoda laboriosa TaxID=597456 RepID=A0A0L7QJE2_9HYME|nr:hypothetical protein WH47_10112 [Habropoda laboriosa]
MIISNCGVTAQVSLIGKEASHGTDRGISTANSADEKKVKQNQKTLKYYFNRFRYYHYCFVEKLDTLIGVFCLTLLKIYFFLMGWDNQFLVQDNEKTNMIDVSDE